MEPVNLINKINKKENININRNSRNNYYYLKYEEHLSSYISNNINLYIKDKKKEKIDINSIYFNDDTYHLIFISIKNDKIFLVFISNEAKVKEIELIFPAKKRFEYGFMKLSEDKRHIILFNENKNKIFIIFDYIKNINLNDDKINLENFYENKEKLIDVKFNNVNYNMNDKNDKDLILYGINCDNNNLTLFNNNYLNKEFPIYFNQPFVDFQIVKNSYNGYDLYVMNSYGNFRVVKNIQNIKNIPKSDKSELFEKNKIYDRIVHNINNCPTLYKNDFVKFYLEPQNDINEKIQKETKIMTVLRLSKHILDIGVLTNDKIFLIKKYYFDEDNEKDNISINDVKTENINSIIHINHSQNQYLIIHNNIIYCLVIPSLFDLYLPLNEDNCDNEEQKKQEILLTINDIISKITLSIILKLPLEKDTNFAITYNFYEKSIFCIQKKDFNLMIKIYNLELDDQTQYENESNNAIIYDKDNNNINTNTYMENILQELKIEIDNLKAKEIQDKTITEYANKVLQEFSANINNLLNIYQKNKNINDINNNINKINNWYKNLYIFIQVYGQKIKAKNEFINECLKNRAKYEEIMKKEEENMNNVNIRINNKLKMIEENQNKIMNLRNENYNNMYKYYLMNMSNKNEQKSYCNELIKRVNNHTMKNINFIQEKINENNDLNKVNFEELKNFPLTMKYLNNAQLNEIKNIINMIKQLKNVLLQYHEQLKKEEIK